MKALSVRQPWAWLIVEGHKNIENRTWTTQYRGPLLIHASQTFADPSTGYRNISSRLDITLPPPPAFHKGGIVGKAELVGVTEESDSPWFEGPYGWEIKDQKRVEFVPCKGQLGLWSFDGEFQEVNQNRSDG